MRADLDLCDLAARTRYAAVDLGRRIGDVGPPAQ
jgi:hypothetical protein